MGAFAGTLSSTPDRLIAASTEVMKWDVGTCPGAGATFYPLDRADTWESWSSLDYRFTTRRFPWLSWVGVHLTTSCQFFFCHSFVWMTVLVWVSATSFSSASDFSAPVGASERRGLSVDSSACCSNVVHVQRLPKRLKFVTPLASVYEPQSCQTYLATQDCSNVLSLLCSPVVNVLGSIQCLECVFSAHQHLLQFVIIICFN